MIRFNLQVPLRDGTRLAADLYAPGELKSVTLSNLSPQGSVVACSP